MMRHLYMLITALALGVSGPAFAQPNADVVVLPFENLSSADGASREISFLVMGAFTSRGWSVASPERVDEILRGERVRYLDLLDGSSRSQVLEATNSRAVVTGSIYEFTEGSNPTVAVSARLVTAGGTLAWSNAAVVSASETEGLFGFGRQSNLSGVAVAAVAELIKTLPKPGDSLRPAPGPEKRTFLSEPTFYVAPDAVGPAPKAICVLPFVNETGAPDASRVVSDLFALRIAGAGGISVIDAATLRKAALKAGISSFRHVRPEDLRKLSVLVGTPLLLRGTVYEFGRTRGRSGVPKLSIELVLEDARDGRIVWMSQHERRGTDYQGLFLLGEEVSVVGLADRVVSEMVWSAWDALRGGMQDRSAGLRPRNRAELLDARSGRQVTVSGGRP